jgi:hypothetical protein
VSEEIVKEDCVAKEPSNACPTQRPVILSFFGPPALACIRSWGRHGFRVGMICIRTGKQGLPASRFLSGFVSLHPDDLYTSKGLEVIKRFLKEFRASGILSINENLSCWLNDCLPCPGCNIPVWAPRNCTIQSVLSKQSQLLVAQRVGFDTLPTYLIDCRLETMALIPETEFPLCLRPDDPKSINPPFKVQLLDSREDLISFVSHLKKLEKPLLGQRFENLPNLVVHGARTVRGIPIGLQAFLVEHKFQGVTLTIRPVPMEDTLRQHCIEFVDFFKLSGNYHFEFLLDQSRGKIYFLEINGRLGGTTAKVYACGYDEPILALECYGACHSAPQNVRYFTVSSKHSLLSHAMHAARNQLTRMDYPIRSRGQKLALSLYGLFRYKDEILSLSDIKGSVAYYRTLLNSRK